MTKDRGTHWYTIYALMKKAKRLRIKQYSCHHIFGHVHNQSLTKSNCYFRTRAGLQDYNNKAPNDELAIVLWLDIKVGNAKLAHKASVAR